jgi:hypothetical protein
MGLRKKYGIKMKCTEEQLPQKYGTYALTVVENKGSQLYVSFYIPYTIIK